MSDIGIYTTPVKSIHNHPYADRLEIAKIFGTQVTVTKGEFTPGEVVTYFPPDMMIPKEVSEKFGVTNYLRSGIYDGKKQRCRIAAAKIRQIPSYGFIVKSGGLKAGLDLTKQFGGQKYQPPVKMSRGDSEREATGFFRYTNIQHYWRFVDNLEAAIKEQGDCEIVITEKLHGANFRLGRVDGTTCIGSHNVQRKLDRCGLYGVAKQDGKIEAAFKKFKGDVVFYGEVYGMGVQDMDYGTDKPTYAIFDIAVGGTFLPPLETYQFCLENEIPHVPVLYVGPYAPQIIAEYTCGPTYMQPSRYFSGREGIVIKPVKPAFDGKIGRVVLKSVSDEYYARKETK